LELAAVGECCFEVQNADLNREERQEREV
jgi:hypothetical protein